MAFAPLNAADCEDGDDDEEAGLLPAPSTPASACNPASPPPTPNTDPSPLESASALSLATFAWLGPLLDQGLLRQLSPSDLSRLPARDSAAAISITFDSLWRAAPVGGRNRLGLTLLRLCRPLLLRGGIFKLVYDSSLMLGPVSLRALLDLIENGAHAKPPFFGAPFPEEWRGPLYVAVMFTSACCSTLCISQYFHFGFEAGMQACH